MKFIKTSTLILAFCLFPSTNSQTHEPANPQTYKMIFWYPGEAGTTQDAQTPLNDFFSYINKKIAPESITGKYFNTIPAGLNYIKKEKPKLGILSYVAFTSNNNAKTLLQTLPLPDGKPTENYVIVGKGPKPANWNIPLYTKQPLSMEFLKDYILNDRTTVRSYDRTNVIPNMLLTLKDIAAGTKTGAAILQPMEYFTLKNLEPPWAKDLNVWHTSMPIPTAPLVTFGDIGPVADKIKNVLLKMSSDPAAAPILETLRLKGFSAP